MLRLMIKIISNILCYLIRENKLPELEGSYLYINRVLKKIQECKNLDLK